MDGHNKQYPKSLESKHVVADGREQCQEDHNEVVLVGEVHKLKVGSSGSSH